MLKDTFIRAKNGSKPPLFQTNGMEFQSSFFVDRSSRFSMKSESISKHISHTSPVINALKIHHPLKQLPKQNSQFTSATTASTPQVAHSELNMVSTKELFCFPSSNPLNIINSTPF
jgi:hypothetical protein